MDNNRIDFLIHFVFKIMFIVALSACIINNMKLNLDIYGVFFIPGIIYFSMKLYEKVAEK